MVEPFPRATARVALEASMLVAFPDKGGQGQGGLFFGGGLVDTEDFFGFVEAVADGVDVDGELVGDGLG